MKRTNLINLKRTTNAGFTLVELLVVIAVIGVLAVAVILAIDPVTKINQAKDSQIAGDFSQIANALQSYYTSQTTPTYPTALTDLTTSGDLKTLPTKPTGGTGQYNYFPLGTAPNQTVVLYTGAFNQKDAAAGQSTLYCWDNTTNKVQRKVYANASIPTSSSTVCP